MWLDWERKLFAVTFHGLTKHEQRLRTFLNQRPTKAEMQEVVDQLEDAGFSGFVGAIVCMKLQATLKNCLIAYKEQYHSPKKESLLLYLRRLGVTVTYTSDIGMWVERGQTMISTCW